jgi:hypothetical protein
MGILARGIKLRPRLLDEQEQGFDRVGIWCCHRMILKLWATSAEVPSSKVTKLDRRQSAISARYVHSFTWEIFAIQPGWKAGLFVFG